MTNANGALRTVDVHGSKGLGGAPIAGRRSDRTARDEGRPHAYRHELQHAQNSSGAHRDGRLTGQDVLPWSRDLRSATQSKSSG